jgi:AraC-like DNA-binding protein
MRDLWTTITSAEVVDLGPHISDIALQLVAAAYAGVPDARTNGTCLITWHRARIRAYVEEHLCEPDLSPRTIADALKISTGYMHRIFRGGNESVARYVLRRRLEECHRALSDPMRLPRGVTSIAFSHGFNSLPYFCRTFRDRYGVTASDFQRFRTFGADTDPTDAGRPRTRRMSGQRLLT